MNSTQAREISIEKVLQNLGCEPTKSNENESWYLSLLELKKQPLLSSIEKLIDGLTTENRKVGTFIDFVIQKFGFSVNEALSYLEKFDTFFSFQKQIFETPTKELNSTNHIKKILPVQHVALIQYLKNRQIHNSKNIKQLKEIHYTINEKNHFALGFQNKSQGWEIRSKYAKICLGKKDISLIYNESKNAKNLRRFF
ncbi:hypothetical protein [Flavobacterium sp. LM5]|uniref:hypothetical protein n=1 Tax=Flavobacterium sp. LM5 TaxID=1938610 RepID=UPI000993DD44|nr:hypothetical protein [Flavobacterium sp. LM5]